uniref:BRCA1-associated protein n=1 Tax=Plectus sambesii TaxID=2011161 RepID=A0A914WUY1_9BILA
MNEEVSLTLIRVRLQVRTGSPFIDLDFTADNRFRDSTAMPQKRKPQAKPTQAAASISSECAAPPVAKEKSSNPEVRPTQEVCMGSRTFAEVTVETYAPQKSGPDAQTTGAARSSSEPSSTKELEKMNYFSGNPFVEKTEGILHVYKRNETSTADVDARSQMLCMLSVPALVTCRELLQFLAPVSKNVAQIRIIRDQAPNQYMVLLKFRSQAGADEFYYDYNGRQFNSIEPDVCHLVYVDRVETVKEEERGCLPVDGHTELPTCPVCLERMDESVDGVLTILCNHSFHGDCLSQWGDASCPVCRYFQTPELTTDQKCFECGKTTDLWICLICGHIGCGRYAEAHAYRHFEATSHTFTLQVGGERVWDYAGDNYVHRLIQSKTDGKVVEFEQHRNAENVTGDEKMEAIQLEYTCLLTNQLENQRRYFEEKVARSEERLAKFEKLAQAQIDDLELQVKRAVDECESLKSQLNAATSDKSTSDRKQNTAQTK